MSNSIKYVPIIKTGDAEMRGIENLSEAVKDRITPLIELTRSRFTKSKRAPRGDIFRRIERLTKAYGKRQIILDLTSIPELSNDQIQDLLLSDDGYRNWVNFVVDLREDLPDLIPIIQLKEDVDDVTEIESRLKRQVRRLADTFEMLSYRLSIMDEAYQDDLRVIKEEIPNLGDKMICVIDCDFVGRGRGPAYATYAKDIINNLVSLGIKNIVLSATSFPQNPTEYGDDEQGEYNLEEITIFTYLQNELDSDIKKKVNLIYGDYACINPNRNDQRGGNPWIPRIDIPTNTHIFYRRSRRNRDVEDYERAYTRVAQSIVRNENYRQLRARIGPCWGIEQVELAAAGEPQGLAPSFWISVRMNIHITLQSLVRS
jgi:hypothetical protein